MHRPTIFLFVVAMLFLLSCNDKEVQPSIAFPSEYHKSGVEPGDGFRVYTREGELRDKLILEKFIGIDSTYFNNMNYNMRRHGFYDSIKFSPIRQASLVGYWKTDCTTSGSGGLIVLTQNDTIDRCCSYPEVLTRTFDYYIVQIKPNVFSESIYSSTRGAYLFTYVYQPKFVLMKYDGKLVAPFIQYVRHSDTAYEQGELNNLPVLDFYKYLTEGDTLILTNSFITFELTKQ
jgi:hypothetical protein